MRTAIGFDSERGDVVEAVNLQFAPDAKPQDFGEGASAGIGLTTTDYLRIVELVMLALIGLVLFVIRPLLRRILSPEGSLPPQLAAPTGQYDGEGADPALAGEQALPAPPPQPIEPPKAKVDEVLDIDKINGEVQENSIRKVADLVKGNLDEAVAIMRQWMAAEAR